MPIIYPQDHIARPSSQIDPFCPANFTRRRRRRRASFGPSTHRVMDVTYGSNSSGPGVAGANHLQAPKREMAPKQKRYAATTAPHHLQGSLCASMAPFWPVAVCDPTLRPLPPFALPKIPQYCSISSFCPSFFQMDNEPGLEYLLLPPNLAPEISQSKTLMNRDSHRRSDLDPNHNHGGPRPSPTSS